MGKRKHGEEEAKKIKKKLEKWQKRLKKTEEKKEEERSSTPTGSPPNYEPSTPKEDTILLASDEDEVPEELLQALGPEGADTVETGEPIHNHLASRWKNIMRDGLKKETRDEILNKYPVPENFQASAPVLNPEIKAVMSEVAIKRDNRLIWRQNLTGKMLTALGKTLTNVMKGNINSKDIVEHLSNAAKIGAELYQQDTMSRKYFALSGTNTIVRDAIKNEKPDDMLFGQNCTEKIKSAQTIQKTGAQIKEKKNFKSPLPNQQKIRSGHNLQLPNYHQRPQSRPQPRPQPRHQSRPQQRPPRSRTVQRMTQQRKHSPLKPHNRY
ncbi:hypothetical protein ABMA28_005975 [Loxostege sticticalis]|uniref:Uncharacterized protein n=3 Tax=Loxostege sticticalis TaxID=481309 RepID=A0ABD0SJK5_LOXSC